MSLEESSCNMVKVFENGGLKLGSGLTAKIDL